MDTIDELQDNNNASDSGIYSWSNWSTYAPTILYSAMNSIMAVANQTPLPDFNQDFRQNSLTYNLSRV